MWPLIHSPSSGINMSFDLSLLRFKDGDVAEADRDAFRAVLFRCGVISPDQFGQYSVKLPSGSCIEVSATNLEKDGLFTGCSFHRGYSIEACEFIFDLAAATDLVICNLQGKDPVTSPAVILTRESQRISLHPGMIEHSRLAESGLHLSSLLQPSYESWLSYRDQVRRGIQDS